MEELLKKVSEKLRPDKPVEGRVAKAVSAINKEIEKQGAEAECIVGGSVAKGTYIKGDFDVDLFVRFEKGEKKISDKLGKILGGCMKKVDRVHGSRDYFQAELEGLTFEVVPVIKIKDYKEAENVTDMSPLHVEYVVKWIEQLPGLEDEIRLGKQFCKAARVYGAESYIQGFSGHVVDLLTIYYHSFTNLLMQASVWGEKVVIDLESHLGNPEEELNEAKTESPLIIVDPVQPDRNAAAAVSKERFEMFKQAAKNFLKDPREEFFEVKKLTLKDIKNKAEGKWKALILEAEPRKGKKDVSGGKVMKAFDHLMRELKNYDFTVEDSGWEFDEKKSRMYFIVLDQELPKEDVREGPPAADKENASAFKKKHKNAYEENGRLYAEVKRKYTKPEELLEDLIKKKYVEEKVKSVKLR